MMGDEQWMVMDEKYFGRLFTSTPSIKDKPQIGTLKRIRDREVKVDGQDKIPTKRS